VGSRWPKRWATPYGVRPTDMLHYVEVPLIPLAAGFIASFFPAR
jgi:hypothetical protein